LGVGGEFLGKDFQRDGSLEPRIVGQVNFAHPTGAKLGTNLIGAEICTCGKRRDLPFSKLAQSMTCYSQFVKHAICLSHSVVLIFTIL
jgi:hypothetical protein